MGFRLVSRAVLCTAVAASSTLLFTGVASAATSTTINGATAVGGGGATVSVTYSCDPSSDARRLTAVIEDKTSGGLGAGFVEPTCNSQSHTVSVPVRPSAGAFNHGDTAKIATDLVDGLGDSVPGAGRFGTVTLG
ncbi:hypothetical protein AB0M22_08375 [Nocardia sp. NPDC051756]|uniref:hypothetical protein n=1 Tax=Nocardia sp. NPDC051756 TaxID=3154751 RepID=UPI003419F585